MLCSHARGDYLPEMLTVVPGELDTSIIPCWYLLSASCFPHFHVVDRVILCSLSCRCSPHAVLTLMLSSSFFAHYHVIVRLILSSPSCRCSPHAFLTIMSLSTSFFPHYHVVVGLMLCSPSCRCPPHTFPHRCVCSSTGALHLVGITPETRIRRIAQ